MKRSFKMKTGGLFRIMGREEAEIHRKALMKRLHEALEQDPATTGLTLPPEFEVSPVWNGDLRVQIGDIYLVENSYVVTNAWRSSRADAVKDSELHDILHLARKAIRQAAQISTETPPPSWKVLVHPVALALALSHEPDRSRYPLTIRAGQKAGKFNWDVDDGGYPTHIGRQFTSSADTRLWDDNILKIRRLGVIMPRTLSCVTFMSIGESDPGSLTFPGQIPDVLKSSLKGRALGEVLEMPPSGHDEIDALAASCRISGYEDTSNGITLRFDPVDHIPYGEAPDEYSRRAMRLALPNM